MQSTALRRLDIAALLSGAAGIGFAPIFVRLSDVGPSATAFYRVLFALPFLATAVLLESVGQNRASARGPRPAAAKPEQRYLWACVLAGFFFAGDLAFWHWSIKLTSVANSTLLTNCAPVFVIVGARLIFGEPITPALVIGMAVATCGAVLLLGASVHLRADDLLGDLLALVTAGFYGSYLLCVKYARRRLSAARILALSGLISCGCLLAVALISHEAIRISTLRGWLVLLGLGIVSHVGGQGLITYALARLPAGFSSIGLLFQPVVAAVLAWTLLAEALSWRQLAGGTVILTGIALASQNRVDGEPQAKLARARPCTMF
jgi:drug/metabolite transporter (DMT)-like permease